MKDGVKIGKTVYLPELANDTIVGVLKEFKINNADVVIRSRINIDQLIDCIEGNKKYVPAITVLNKIDMVPAKRAEEVAKKIKADLLVSAKNKEHIEELKDLIFEKLNLIRIYMKEPGKEPDLDVPMIIGAHSSVEDVCSKLHKDFVSKFRFSRVWGKSAKFEGQKHGLKHRLQDGDILEIHLE